MDDLATAQRDFLRLRDSASAALLATIENETQAEASYAPLTWFEGDCYLFLSELASHTRNLIQNPNISLMILQSESDSGNAFARRRISLQGRTSIIERDSDAFRQVLNLFWQRFGKVMEMIEPLPDFHLFRVQVERGRFIRGFGQAYEIVGDRLDRLQPVDPRQ